MMKIEVIGSAALLLCLVYSTLIIVSYPPMQTISHNTLTKPLRIRPSVVHAVLLMHWAICNNVDYAENYNA